MPKAVESFNFKGFDLVLSITSALVKGIKTESKTLHICYCNTPTRWLWSDSKSYLQTAPIPIFAKPIIPLILRYLKKWDLQAASRPDYFIANSKNVQHKIEKYYKRQSTPIFVPVDTSKFKQVNTIGKYFLIVSRIEPYKKVDLAIKAFKKLNLPLKIVGSGSCFEDYRKNNPENIKLLGRLDDENLVKMYQGARATIFPQEEDAGIVPLESMACGRPVIAYAKGGALETIIDGKTGVLFNNQTVEGLISAVKKFQKINFDARIILCQAKKFDKELFKRKILEYIRDKLNKFEIRNSKSETNSKL